MRLAAGASPRPSPSARARPTKTFSMHAERREQREVLERPRDPEPGDPVRGQREQVVAVEGDRARSPARTGG